MSTSSISQVTAAPVVVSLSTARRKSYAVRHRILMSPLTGGRNSSSSSSSSKSGNGIVARSAIRARAGDGKVEGNGEGMVVVERVELKDGGTMFVFGDEPELPQAETETATAVAVETEIDTQIAQDDTPTSEDHEAGPGGADEDPTPLPSELDAPEESSLPEPEARPDIKEANDGAVADEEQGAEPSPGEGYNTTTENLGSSSLGDSSSWVEVGNQPLNGDSVSEEESRQRTKFVFNQSTSQDSLPAQPQSFSPSYSGSLTMSSFHKESSLESGESTATKNYDSDYYSKRDQASSTSISSVSYSPVSSSAVLTHPDDRSVEDLESRNLVELRSQAKELGITFSALKKNELVHAIHAVRRYQTEPHTGQAGEKGVLDEIALQALSPGELREICAKHNMKGRASASKAKMIEFLTDLRKYSGDIQNYSVGELRGLAKEVGIRGFSNATREELIEWLEF